MGDGQRIHIFRGAAPVLVVKAVRVGLFEHNFQNIIGESVNGGVLCSRYVVSLERTPSLCKLLEEISDVALDGVALLDEFEQT